MAMFYPKGKSRTFLKAAKQAASSELIVALLMSKICRVLIVVQKVKTQFNQT